uniref:Uncharacterized protein n=1 Tax=Pygocentrus nattereri TaxID=42514 RepID=A0A3B4CUS2_PYGNA
VPHDPRKVLHLTICCMANRGLTPRSTSPVPTKPPVPNFSNQPLLKYPFLSARQGEVLPVHSCLHTKHFGISTCLVEVLLFSLMFSI